MQYVIEKIANHEACLSPLTTGSDVFIACSLLPSGVKEGDILLATSEGYILDTVATQARLDVMNQRLQRLFNRS